MTGFCNHAELPRDVREALVSWNHAQDYDCPTYEDYAGRLGGGQFEKVYDLGARAHAPVSSQTQRAHTTRCQTHCNPKSQCYSAHGGYPTIGSGSGTNIWVPIMHWLIALFMP